MDIKKLQRAIVDGLEDVKGQNILVFDTEHLSSLFERVIIASGTSNRQTKALSTSVRDAVKRAGFPVPRTEGEDNGEWIIVDCGSAVVHVMQPNIREYYHLEEIWGGKPVKLKLDSAPKRLVKAEEVESAPKKKAPARKTAAQAEPEAAPAKKTAARKSATRVVEAEAPATAAHSPARKSAAAKAPAKTAAPAKTPAAKRAAPVKAGVTRTVGVKSAAAAPAKTAARKATAPSARVAKKAPVQVIAVNKPTTKKAANARAAAKAAPAKRTSAAKTAAKAATKPAAKKAPRSA